MSNTFNNMLYFNAHALIYTFSVHFLKQTNSISCLNVGQSWLLDRNLEGGGVVESSFDRIQSMYVTHVYISTHLLRKLAER